MMQKDEEFLLEPWLLHHGYLFGFENLTVFDNGSVSEQVIATLRRFAASGVTVHWRYDQQSDWLAKGELFTSVIRAWDNGEPYDFAIPLDCDEFLALYTPQGMTCRRPEIHDYFESLLGCTDVFLIETTNLNVPGQVSWFWPGRGAKHFFAAGSIEYLDHGFHVARSRLSSEIKPTLLTHLHFQNKPYASVMLEARRKLAPFVDVDDLQAVLGFTGSGEHLIRHFRYDEAGYLAQYDGFMTFGFSGLTNTLRSLATSSPMFDGEPDFHPDRYVTIRIPAATADKETRLVFDAEAYLNENLDVASLNTTVALYHYLHHGHYEGRRAFDMRHRDLRPL